MPITKRCRKIAEMKIVLIIGVVAFLAGCRGGVEHGVIADDSETTRPGLTKEGAVELENLLRLQTDIERFQAAIEELIQRKEKQTLFILTHAMFELPFDPNDFEGPTTVPILIVERALDNLVFAEDSHDQLSARYFRALTGEGDVESAKAALLNWTVESHEELVFTGNQLSFPDQHQNQK